MKVLNIIILGFLLVLAGTLNAQQGPEIEKFPFIATSHLPHKVKVLNQGPASFEQYVRMIEGATKSIDMDFYIWGSDPVGLNLLKILVDKANAEKKEFLEGRRKRLMPIHISLDGYSWTGGPAFSEYVVAEIRKSGIRVKYYNYTKNKLKQTYRNHRKLLIVDGEQLIVGGRNMDAESFGSHDYYNYLDRDIWVKGPVVSAAKKGFDLYWKSKVMSKPENPNMVKTLGLPSFVEKFFFKRPDDWSKNHKLALWTMNPEKESVEEFEKAREVGSKLLSEVPEFEVNDISFVTDPPALGKKYVTGFLDKQLWNISKTLLVENYTFIPWKERREILDSLLNQGVKIEFLTNSIESENATSMVSIFSYKRQVEYTKKGITFYNFKGKAPDDDRQIVLHVSRDYLWGIHTKAMIMDESSVWIGTNNFDPRSDGINIEAGVFIKNSEEVAKYVGREIRQRMKQAYILGPTGQFLQGPYIPEPEVNPVKLKLVETFLLNQY